MSFSGSFHHAIDPVKEAFKYEKLKNIREPTQMRPLPFDDTRSNCRMT